MQFLIWQVKAVMGSWGGVASGVKSRQVPTDLYPTKSAILGMVTMCAGHPLTSDEGVAIESGLGFAYMASAGSVWGDYHTVQSNPTPAEGPYQNRWEELRGQNGEALTTITRRNYVSDVNALVCVYKTDNTAFTLEDLLNTLEMPKTAPFVGRRSCPVTAPFLPKIIEADNPVEALRKAAADYQVQAGRIGYEGPWPGLTPTRTEHRRDQPSNRRMWLFNTRAEHVIL